MAAEIRWRVGLIANPESGKDVRRLAAEAQVVSTADKIAAVRKLVVGLTPARGLQLLAAVDDQDIPGRAWRSLREARRPDLSFESVSYPLTHSPDDTVSGTRALVAAGADLVVSLGGDGTHRLVAEALGQRPLIPISSGTNNTFGLALDPTLIGLALARALQPGPIPARALFCPGRLRVAGPFGTLAALVDVAVLPWQERGKAVWDAASLSTLFLTQGEPTALGLSSLLGQAEALPARRGEGRVVVVDPQAARRVWCPLSPGLLAQVGVAEIRRLDPAVPETVFGPATLAFDGEPLVSLAPGEEATVSLEEGPWVFDPLALLGPAQPSSGAEAPAALRQALEESLISVIGRLSAEAASDSLYGDEIPLATAEEVWQRPIAFDPRFDLGPDPAVVDELSGAITRLGHPLNLRACVAAAGLVQAVEEAETVGRFRDLLLEAASRL